MYCSCAATISSSTFDRNERLEMGCSWREFLCPDFLSSALITFLFDFCTDGIWPAGQGLVDDFS